jgi:hypothetical protein
VANLLIHSLRISTTGVLKSGIEKILSFPTIGLCILFESVFKITHFHTQTRQDKFFIVFVLFAKKITKNFTKFTPKIGQNSIQTLHYKLFTTIESQKPKTQKT